MSIRRKVLLSAAAVALPLTLIGVAGVGPASAATAVNAPGSLTCTGISGSVKFKPPLTLTAGGTSVSAKGDLSGCTGTGGESGVTGKFKATIASTGTGCAGLAGGTSEEVFTVKWKGDLNGAKAKFNPSTITVHGSTIVTNSHSDEGFELPAPGHAATVTTGSFAGSTSVESYAYTTETAAAFSAACGPGIKSVTIGSGSINHI